MPPIRIPFCNIVKSQQSVSDASIQTAFLAPSNIIKNVGCIFIKKGENCHPYHHFHQSQLLCIYSDSKPLKNSSKTNFTTSEANHLSVNSLTLTNVSSSLISHYQLIERILNYWGKKMPGLDVELGNL